MVSEAELIQSNEQDFSETADVEKSLSGTKNFSVVESCRITIGEKIFEKKNKKNKQLFHQI